jgi:hypothetical protein
MSRYHTLLFQPLTGSQPYVQFNGSENNVPSRFQTISSASPTTPREIRLDPESVEHGRGLGTQPTCSWE